MLTYFINPYLLWGTLAVAIPIVIHFWHQKRGTVLPWAATQWLVEKNQQQQRGFKFDNLPLLLLRSLLVLVLALLLSQPIINWLGKQAVAQPIHLVQPDALLVSTFRFELEEALKKGEKVYWANADTDPVTTLALPRQSVPFTPLTLQSAIDRLAPARAPLHLYVVNTEHLADVPFVYVPTPYHLHTVVDSSRGQRNFLASTPTKLFVNGTNRLTSGAELPQTIRFASAATHEGAVSVGLQFRDKTERQTVGAALDALTDVYKMTLAVADRSRPDRSRPDRSRPDRSRPDRSRPDRSRPDRSRPDRSRPDRSRPDRSRPDRSRPDQSYDVILTDRLPGTRSAKTLYIVSGIAPLPGAANVMAVSEPFTPQASDLVASGQLPEWLGERLVAWFGLNPTPLPLSQQQLNALFVPATRTGNRPAGEETSAAVHGGLLLLFIVLIGAERWLALTKNA